MEIIRAAARHSSRLAIKLHDGATCSYGKLLQSSEAVHSELQKLLPATTGSIDGPRIGVYAEPGIQYAAATWASWMSGGIAVPLAVSHPQHEFDYVIRDAGISAVLTGPSGHDKLKEVSHATGAKLHVIQDSLFQGPDTYLAASGSNADAQSTERSLPGSSGSSSGAGSGALIVYTSGTTGRPKGALHTHGSLLAQVQCLTQAWQWSPTDVMAHALPLHHVHGIINGLYCAQHVGAAVHFLPKFSPAAMWQQLMSGEISVLMAVPTMYSYLLAHYNSHIPQQDKAAAAAAVGQLRLTVSGSAAAPVPLLQQWKALSGQQLLERYGMTETGMILSNPYQGERRPGFVGVALPGVEVKLVQQESNMGSSDVSSSSSNSDSIAGEDGGSVGELAIRGPMLFREYWGRPEATAAAFDEQGYFLTGDTVSLEGNPPYYRILGRSSVDIIKSGGYKISALDVESALLHHPAVAEAAVLGVPDDMLGQVIAALVYPKASEHSSSSSSSASSDNKGCGSTAKQGSMHDDLIQQLQRHSKEELSAYSVPRIWKVLEQPLPRNAMGKINKKELLKVFFPA